MISAAAVMIPTDNKKIHLTSKIFFYIHCYLHLMNGSILIIASCVGVEIVDVLCKLNNSKEI
jgi:hypothetical protein